MEIGVRFSFLLKLRFRIRTRRARIFCSVFRIFDILRNKATDSHFFKQLSFYYAMGRDIDFLFPLCYFIHIFH